MCTCDETERWTLTVRFINIVSGRDYSAGRYQTNQPAAISDRRTDGGDSVGPTEASSEGLNRTFLIVAKTKKTIGLSVSRVTACHTKSYTKRKSQLWVKLPKRATYRTIRA
jgi:hypothetical protein